MQSCSFLVARHSPTQDFLPCSRSSSFSLSLFFCPLQFCIHCLPCSKPSFNLLSTSFSLLNPPLSKLFSPSSPSSKLIHLAYISLTACQCGFCPHPVLPLSKDCSILVNSLFFSPPISLSLLPYLPLPLLSHAVFELLCSDSYCSLLPFPS